MNDQTTNGAGQGSQHSSNGQPWSVGRRLTVSAVLAVFLLIVVMGPVTNPIYTEELTGPVGRFIAPAHQALYLGHGYRFFAPDPGPSHLLVYRVTRADGTQIEQRFPNRDTIWPRLMYHRWFMLSETIYNEFSMLPNQEVIEEQPDSDAPTRVWHPDVARSENEFRERQQDLQRQIDLFIESGHWGVAKQLQSIARRNERGFARDAERRQRLIDAVGRELLRRHEGDRVELYLQEREIPAPANVLLRQRLSDPRFLSDLLFIGEVSRSETGAGNAGGDQE